MAGCCGPTTDAPVSALLFQQIFVTVLVNTLIALPLYAIVKRILQPVLPEDPRRRRRRAYTTGGLSPLQVGHLGGQRDVAGGVVLLEGRGVGRVVVDHGQLHGHAHTLAWRAARRTPWLSPAPSTVPA